MDQCKPTGTPWLLPYISKNQIWLIPWTTHPSIIVMLALFNMLQLHGLILPLMSIRHVNKCMTLLKLIGAM